MKREPDSIHDGAALRRWASRATLVVAALASMATSRAPRWGASAPEVAVTGTPGRGRVVVVEASVEPRVTIRSADGTERPASRSPTDMWSGSGKYFVPPGWSLKTVDINGPCSGGCGRCAAPSGAFVRIARIDVVDTWTAEDTLTVPVTFAEGHAVAQLAVDVDSSGSIDLTVVPAPGSTLPDGGLGTPAIYDPSASGTRTVSVNLYGPLMPAATTIDYVLTATMHGICGVDERADAGVNASTCADAGAGRTVAECCRPPAGAHVKIVTAKQR